ncbi:MAG: cytochrome P450, partial [Nitrospira sp.]|nr:cytochrome P450 [Nitrospira sp.]
KQVRDEAMTVFLAGHETTADALTWSWYLLAQNPDAEAKLHQEIDTVLSGRLPTPDDVPKLKYTNMVFAEAMRLYPPLWITRRRVLNDYQIDRYILPAGSVVLMSQYVMHHDPRYFPDPFKFDPERWTPEAESKLPRGAYFPFGAGGPRQCLGEGFSWMEGTLIIATLARKWRMRFVPGHPIELLPAYTLRPKYGIHMVLERIK